MAELKLIADSGGGTIALKAPATTTSNAAITLKLPVADGSANQLLKTDGSGNLGWATDSATDSSKMPLAGGTFTGSVDFQGEINFTGNGHKYIDVATLNGGHSFTVRHQDGSSYETGLTLDANGAAKLFYNNSQKFETTSTGATISGLLAVSGSTSQTSTFTGNGLSVVHASGSNMFIGTQSGTDGKIAVTNNADLHFRTNNTERLRIISDGKVVIGGNYTNSANFGRQVLIDGTLGINNDSGTVGIGFSKGNALTYGYIGTGAWAVNGAAADDFGITSGSTGDLLLGSAATERLRITAGGLVGINQSTPTERLHVVGNAIVTGMIMVGDGTTSNCAIANIGDSHTGMYFPAANTVGFSADGSEKLKIDSGGATIKGNLVLENTDQSKILSHTADGSDDNWLSINGGGDASQSRGGGITGFGNEVTNHQGKLSLAAGNSGSTNGTIDFTTGGSERARIDSSGKVGINTTSPAHKLHVEDSVSNVIVAKQTTNNGGHNTFAGVDSFGNVKFYATHNGRVGAADGIIFGSDTSGDNVLSDYEEGSWSASSLNYDYDGNQAQRGQYIKIGKMVYAFYRIKFHTQSNYTGQHLRWTGLPFTAIGASSPNDIGVGSHAHEYGTIDFFRTYVQPGSTYCYWYDSDGDNYNNSTSLNNADIRGCIIYRASS